MRGSETEKGAKEDKVFTWMENRTRDPVYYPLSYCFSPILCFAHRSLYFIPFEHEVYSRDFGRTQIKSFRQTPSRGQIGVVKKRMFRHTQKYIVF